MRRLRCEQGFTLIELIAVIVVLGILAVVAVPKYSSLKDDAEQATAHGVTAALMGSIAMKHANYLLHTTEYTAADVIANVDVGNVTLGATAAEITAELPSANVYTWTYTDRSGNSAAQVAEGW